MTFKEYLKRVIPIILKIALVIAIAKLLGIKPMSYWW